MARMYPKEHYLELREESLIASVPLCIFVFTATVFLANLLVAQLTHTYHDAHANMEEGQKSIEVGVFFFGCLRLNLDVFGWMFVADFGCFWVFLVFDVL